MAGKTGSLLIVACLCLMSGCASQIGYLAKQGTYLLRYGTGTRAIQSMIDDPVTAPATREFLERVKLIRRSAVDAVGLVDNGNYTRYKEIDRDHLVDVVSACESLSFEPYRWSYPVLGKLPYKGFYERADADAEAARIKSLGYDVIVRPVDAFSTLGFTRDPVYSFMATYSPFELASLIIHEQTHATLFVKGQDQFNEELATFVGDEGAFLWLRDVYGGDSAEYQTAADEQTDGDRYASMLRALADELDAVYRGALPAQDKLGEKATLIGAFRERLARERATLFRSEAWRGIKDQPIDNAYLSLYRLYLQDIPLLRAYWQERCGSDLKRFMQAARGLARKGDVKALMRSELSGG
jgi:predicted aminopeptidase